MRVLLFFNFFYLETCIKKHCFALSVVLFLISNSVFSQTMKISGNVQDTISNRPLEYSLVMAIRIKDSILIAYTRSDKSGHFELKDIPLDTIQITISNTKFGDQLFYVFGSPTNSVFDFGNIVLPPKNLQLKEVIIYAFKDPIYYKGDTLVYTADSFKVKPNAMVEDLLKKLPGIQVNANGTITAQGKEVSQVLVDGDEFFGNDQTVITKNLAANNIESVQIYEKKDDKAGEGEDETIKVLNLKLKDESKKGYFGKVSAGTDARKFYEGDLLANKFSDTRKISIFSLISNTPNSTINWSDIYKYGLDNETNYQIDENGDYTFSNLFETVGIPQTIKSGIYYNDKLGKKTKLGLNYTYNDNQLITSRVSKAQYFLSDTSYSTNDTNYTLQKSKRHSINFKVTQTLDSLTELIVEPKFNLNAIQSKGKELTRFLGSTDSLSRQTHTSNQNNISGYDLSTNIKLNRAFKIPERSLLLSYNFSMSENNSTGILESFNSFSDSVLQNDSVNQQKTVSNTAQAHNAVITYTEPITKKINIEFEYIFNSSIGTQNKETKSYLNGEYTIYDSLFSNYFENSRMTNRLGLKFIYETKKQSINLGTRIRNVEILNSNLISQQQVKQSVNNVLPYFGYVYKFNDNNRFNFKYYTASSQPSINQLQPIPDITNPNQILVGNPNLLPTFKHNFNASFNTYKPVSQMYMWCRAMYTMTNNAFVNSIVYDSIGKATIMTVNVNGNSYAYAYLTASVPLFKKKLVLGGSVEFNHSKYSNFINKQKNRTQNTGINSKLAAVIQLDTMELSFTYIYNYNLPSSSLSNLSNQPYSQQKYGASFLLKLPYKFLLETDIEHVVNGQRTEGYNIDYTIWNASLSKIFFKKENVILSFKCFDILNNNIHANRIIEDNIIIDNKTNIISRYFLLKLTYKFYSSKKGETGEMF